MNDILFFLKKKVKKRFQLNMIPIHSQNQFLKRIPNSHVFSMELLMDTS